MPFLPELARSFQRKDLVAAPSINRNIPPYPVPPGAVGRPYRSDWDLKRAVEQGYEASIWVMRSVNLIANSAASLPVIMRQGNRLDGPPIDDPMLDLFNFMSSPYENSLLFRKRLAQVLVLNKQGVFVEIVRNRLGDPIALYLLPPGYTWPIPNEQTKVAAYRVQYPGKSWFDVPAESVIWIHEPHPYDMYSGFTPMESAGLDIEADFFARMYQRNFMQNDARPGGILVINGDLEDDEARRLRRRFTGGTGWGVGGAGRLTVMEADGASFVDTSTAPRDAQYAELRQLTKESILSAFGVPESIVGNSSARTFNNASQEELNFWVHTMNPMLETQARNLDVLDPDPRKYLGFDLSRVDAFEVALQTRRAFLLQELNANAISRDEYRMETGRLPVGGGAAKLYGAMANVEVADTNMVDHPLTDRNLPAFDPEIEYASARSRRDLQAKTTEIEGNPADNKIVVSIFPTPAVVAQAKAAGYRADPFTLVDLGPASAYRHDIGRLEATIGRFMVEEAPVAARMSNTGTKSAELDAMRSRLMCRLDTEGLMS